MRAMSNLTGRSEVTASPRARVAFDLCSVLHRRGGAGAARSGWNAGATFMSTRQSLRNRAVVGEAAQGRDVPMITIRMPYRVQFGEVLRVVGSSSLLGDWSADQGLQLTWSEGDVWTAEVPIVEGHYEFKCVIYNVQTNSVARWEDGGNRILDISRDPGMWDVDCKWGATADMTQAFTPVQAAPAPPVAEEAAAAAPVEEAPAEEAAADAAEELLPTFMALSEEAALAKQAQEVEEKAAAAAEVAAAASLAAAAVAAQGANGADNASSAGTSGGGGGAVILLLATCAVGAVAAVALLAPGGLDEAVLGGRASEAVSTTLQQSSVAGEQVRAQVQSQLAALAGHVSAVQAQVSAAQPAVQAQMSSLQDSVADGLSALAGGGTAMVQSQAPDVRV